MRDDILTGILDAPIAPRPWEPLFAALDTLVSDTRTMLKFARVDAPGNVVIRTSTDDDTDGIVELYRQVYRFKDPVRYDGLRQCRLYSFEDLIDRDRLVASDYYREWCEPLGLTHAFFAYLGRFDGVDAWFKGSRNRAFDNKDWQALSEVLPLISKAANYYVRMERYQMQSSLFASSLGHAGIGAIILNGQGHVVQMNHEAERLAVQEGWLPGNWRGCAQNRLHLTPSISRTLSAMLTDIRADKGSQPAFLRLDGAHERPLLLVIRPLHTAFDHGHGAVLYIRQGHWTAHDGVLSALMAFHDLTASEARLAMLLSTGMSLDDVAEQLGLTISTARTYCKRIFTKTGTTRQGELVALIANSISLAELAQPTNA